MDVPCILFVEELIAAYPDAKVILTERPLTVHAPSLCQYHTTPANTAAGTMQANTF